MQPVLPADLMIVQSALPDGWSVSGRGRGGPRGEHRRASQDMLTQFYGSDRCRDLSASQTVYQYSGVLKAAAMRVNMIGIYYSNSPSRAESDWVVPAAWPYRSPAADQFRFACADMRSVDADSVDTWCRALMRYDEYVVFFNAPMSSGCMTLKDVEQSLAAIDAQVETVLTRSRR